MPSQLFGRRKICSVLVLDSILLHLGACAIAALCQGFTPGLPGMKTQAGSTRAPAPKSAASKESISQAPAGPCQDPPCRSCPCCTWWAQLAQSLLREGQPVPVAAKADSTATSRGSSQGPSSIGTDASTGGPVERLQEACSSAQEVAPNKVRHACARPDLCPHAARGWFGLQHLLLV